MASSTNLFLGLTCLFASACFGLRVLVPKFAESTHMWHLLFISAAASLTCIAIWKTYIYPNLFDPLRRIPTVRGGLPFIGYAAEQFRRPPSRKIYEWITTLPNEGLIRYPGVGGYRLIPTSPKVLSELLVTKAYDFQKLEKGRNLLRMVLGDGLVVVEGDLHRFQRKNVNPMFSFRHIKDLYPLMWNKAVELTKCINTEISTDGSPGGSVIEVSRWASRATLDIIGVAALGREFNTLHNSNDELAQLYEWLFRPTMERVVWFVVNIFVPRKLVKLLPWRIESETLSKAAGVRRVCRQLLKNKREAMVQSPNQSIDTLAHLIHSNNFSDDELVDQILTFLAAGHETTSSSLTWLLYLLAKNPEYLVQLREEIQEKVGVQALRDRDTNFAAALESLPWLNAICNEVLRLFPAVPITARAAAVDTEIGGHPIPRGTEFAISIWWLNQSPKLWGPRAGEFYPERWIDAETGKPNNHGGAQSNYAMLTFLHGPRSCIGQNFAKAELRALATAWILSFDFEMAGPKGKDEVCIPFGPVTVKPRDGLWLRVRPIVQPAVSLEM